MNGDDDSRLASMERDTISNICCNNGCNMSTFHIFMLNG